ncbi:MAG: hypothetical protein OEM97_06370 [Acidimicrobiia bacterium]|nr:hypothetical protein [Acidimicrobiia bacterium]
MRKSLWIAILAALMVVVTAVPAFAGNGKSPVGVGQLYHDGEVVRTVVPPAAAPKAGIDDFYGVTNGVKGQLGIAAVAPGDPGYHGGKWAMHLVTWNDGAEPMLLTSAEAVQQHYDLGHLTITRSPGDDFKCPIQP